MNNKPPSLFLFFLLSITFSVKAQPDLAAIDKENNENVKVAGKYVSFSYISPANRSITLNSDVRKAHRLFGFEKADSLSKRLFVLSEFDSDVIDIPFGCTYGAYY